jgi:NTP pyrophosphatase (non-canonical NTP hydrolase)
MKTNPETMNFDDYQDTCLITAVYPHVGDNIYYPALGLAGEAGEIANKIKKVMRDGTPATSIREDIKNEIGDVLWYCAVLAREFDLDLQEIAVSNLEKLADRARRNMIGGSGDHR